MLYEYSNLYFPICSVVISLLITILFFSKKNVKNEETKLYTKIVIITLIEAIYTFGLTLSVHLFFNETTLGIFEVANKVLYAIYIIWISLLAIYFAEISNIKKEYLTIFKIGSFVLDTIIIGIIFSSPISLVYLIEDKVSNSYGTSAIVLYVGCIIYIVLMNIISVLTLKHQKNKIKYLPLIFLVIMMIIAMIIRVIDPYCNVLSNVISLIALIMYFTIENPDYKLMKQLELAKIQVEKSNRVKSDFLSSMSHEIRTPLNTIVGLSESMQSNTNIEEIQSDAKDVIDASHSLLELMDGILNLSIIEADKIELNNETYEVELLLSDLVSTTNMKIGSKEIILRTDFDNNIPKTLYGDRNKVKQIVSNILLNAVKYTETGFIDFCVNAILAKEECELIFKVKDTGKGIKEEQIDKLFEKFYRAEENVNSTIGGAGLGLSIAKSLVELLGGSINVESKYGEGSTFTITLVQSLKNENDIEEKQFNAE